MLTDSLNPVPEGPVSGSLWGEAEDTGTAELIRICGILMVGCVVEISSLSLEDSSNSLSLISSDNLQDGCSEEACPGRVETGNTCEASYSVELSRDEQLSTVTSSG